MRRFVESGHAIRGDPAADLQALAFERGARSGRRLGGRYNAPDPCPTPGAPNGDGSRPARLAARLRRPGLGTVAAPGRLDLVAPPSGACGVLGGRLGIVTYRRPQTLPDARSGCGLGALLMWIRPWRLVSITGLVFAVAQDERSARFVRLDPPRRVSAAGPGLAGAHLTPRHGSFEHRRRRLNARPTHPIPFAHADHTRHQRPPAGRRLGRCAGALQRCRSSECERVPTCVCRPRILCCAGKPAASASSSKC